MSKFINYSYTSSSGWSRSYGNSQARKQNEYSQETKYFDAAMLKAPLNRVNLNGATGAWDTSEIDPVTINTLFLPVLGVDRSNRIGRQVWVTHIEIRGSIYVDPVNINLPTPSFPDSSIARLILFVDKQTNGVRAKAEDVVYMNTTLDGNHIADLYNVRYFDRFEILVDETFVLEDANFIQREGAMQLNYNGKSLTFHWNVEFLEPLIINFNNKNNGDISDIVDNSIHMIGSYQGQSYPVNCRYRSRVSFIE